MPAPAVTSRNKPGGAGRSGAVVRTAGAVAGSWFREQPVPVARPAARQSPQSPLPFQFIGVAPGRAEGQFFRRESAALLPPAPRISATARGMLRQGLAGGAVPRIFAQGALQPAESLP